MKSKTTLGKRVTRKSDSRIVETLIAAKNNKSWQHVAQKLSGSRRRYPSVNLEFLETHTKEGDTVIIIGKVLGVGTLHKKVRIGALAFSASARAKLKQSKSEIVSLIEEIKKNPRAEGVRIIP